MVDIGLLILAAWLGDSLTTGVFVFFMAGGPLTFVIAAPIYGWFQLDAEGGHDSTMRSVIRGRQTSLGIEGS